MSLISVRGAFEQVMVNALDGPLAGGTQRRVSLVNPGEVTVQSYVTGAQLSEDASLGSR